MNPYEILGIKSDATAEQIKRAHRKKSMRTHPDHGGAREDFEAVQKSYEVLSDPERRAHYDRTGEILGEARDETVRILMTTLSGAFMQVLQAIAAEKQSVENCLFIASMQNALDASIKSIDDARIGNVKAKAIFEKMVGRFSVSDGEKPNYLEDILRARIEEVRRHMEQLDSEVARFKMAKQYLADCRYRNDPQTMMATLGLWSQTINTTTGTTL